MTGIVFGPQTCGALDESAAREWLVTDGLGGYAMGTVAGLRTRRYHALLVVAEQNGATRHVGLAALDAVVVIGDRRVELAVHEWRGGVVHPRGHDLLAGFELRDGVPRWQWQIGDVVVEREIAMMHGRPTVAVTYRIVRCAGPVRLELTPLCTWRDAHGDRRAGDAPGVGGAVDGFVFEDAYRVVADATWEPGGDWYRDAYLRAEAGRGLGSEEDLWAAGRFVADLSAGGEIGVVATATLSEASPPAAVIIQSAKARARALITASKASDGTEELLVLAADHFVTAGANGPSVVAGYPWFGAWSRDTMTSYEGLFLSTGRVDEGRDLLAAAAETVSEGMLANTADTGTLEYNTADATLWFLHAIDRHVTLSGDADPAATLAPVMDRIIDHHLAGTRYGIIVDRSDGLLRQGVDGVALTWMDARVDGRAITGRVGKAVEINALWINGLRATAAAQRMAGLDSSRAESLAATAQASFERRFTRPDGVGLFDVVDGPDGDDAAVRPNQLLALSLPRGPGGPPSV